MVPFILLMMGLVWDLRAYIAYHTKVTREIYVVAEVIANETGPTSGENPIGAAWNETEQAGSAFPWLHGATVVRLLTPIHIPIAPSPLSGVCPE